MNDFKQRLKSTIMSSLDNKYEKSRIRTPNKLNDGSSLSIIKDPLVSKLHCT